MKPPGWAPTCFKGWRRAVQLSSPCRAGEASWGSWGDRAPRYQAGLSVSVNQVKVAHKYSLSFQTPNPPWLHKPKQDEGFFSFLSDRAKLLQCLDPWYADTPREAHSLWQFGPFAWFLTCARDFGKTLLFFLRFSHCHITQNSASFL